MTILLAQPGTCSDSISHASAVLPAASDTIISNSIATPVPTENHTYPATKRRELLFSEWDKDLKAKEKLLNNREKKVKHQEAEVSEQSLQIAALKSLVFKLESDVKTMKQENNLLRLAQPSSQHQTDQYYNPQVAHSSIINPTSDVVSKLTDLVSNMTAHILHHDRRPAPHHTLYRNHSKPSYRDYRSYNQTKRPHGIKKWSKDYHRSSKKSDYQAEKVHVVEYNHQSPEHQNSEPLHLTSTLGAHTTPLIEDITPPQYEEIPTVSGSCGAALITAVSTRRLSHVQLGARPNTTPNLRTRNQANTEQITEMDRHLSASTEHFLWPRPAWKQNA